MNTEDSDILFVRLLLFPYYIVEKYAVSDAALVYALANAPEEGFEDFLV